MRLDVTEEMGLTFEKEFDRIMEVKGQVGKYNNFALIPPPLPVLASRNLEKFVDKKEIN